MTQILSGIRILDLTRYVAGPMSTALLADLGADVIRIEPPGGGEDRTPLPIAEGYHGGVGFAQVSRNKRGLTLDLAGDRGKEVFARLLADADMVVANLPHSSMKSLGLNYDRMIAVKPDIILVHITAFGGEGPYADRLGFDGIAQVMSGLTYISGEAGHPMKSAAAWVDMATGFIGAFGAMAALRHRDITGEGQIVEANLFQTSLTVGNYFLIDQAFNQYHRGGTGNRAPSGGPADLIRTKDGWFFIAVLGNPMFRRFARLIGREEELLVDLRFQTDESRAENGEALSEITALWAAQFSTAEALARLESFKIPSGPLLSPQDVLDDPHVKEAFLRPIEVEGLSKPIPYIRPPASFSKTPGSIARGPPAAGEHSDEILAEAGFDDAEIAELKRAGVI